MDGEALNNAEKVADTTRLGRRRSTRGWTNYFATAPHRDDLLARHELAAPEVLVSPGSAPPADSASATKEGHRQRTRYAIEDKMANTSTKQVEDFLCRWMGTEIIRRSRIWDILIPGSHDSASYDCTHKAKGITQKGIMEFIKSFVMTQDKNVYQQLCSGVRFLDLRVCLDPLDGTLTPYCAHGGYRCASLVDVFRDVLLFIETYQTEIVILSCKPDAGYKTGPFAMPVGVCDFWVAAVFWRYLGGRLRTNTTVESLCRNNQRIIYFFGEAERYLPSLGSDTRSKYRQLASQSSVAFDRLDSVLGAPVIRRESVAQTPAPPKTKNRIIRYESINAHPQHQRQSKHSIPLPESEKELVVHILTAYIIRRTNLVPDPCADPKTLEPVQCGYSIRPVGADAEAILATFPAPDVDESKSSTDTRHYLTKVLRKSSFVFKFGAGEVHYSDPGRPASLARPATSNQWLSSIDRLSPGRVFNEIPEDRFAMLPQSEPVRLRPIDAARYKQLGLSRVFFEFPLCARLGKDFVFVSYFKTGRTFITKSWGQTCETNVKFLASKLRFWTEQHGRSVPRTPYKLRILAGEITPPSPDFPQTSNEIIKFWASQSANALFFLPTGARPNANACNKMLLHDVLEPEVVSRVNGVTHDFVEKKIVLTVLFHHIAHLKQYYESVDAASAAASTSTLSEERAAGEAAGGEVGAALVEYELDEEEARAIAEQRARDALGGRL